MSPHGSDTPDDVEETDPTDSGVQADKSITKTSVTDRETRLKVRVVYEETAGIGGHVVQLRPRERDDDGDTRAEWTPLETYRKRLQRGHDPFVRGGDADG